MIGRLWPATLCLWALGSPLQGQVVRGLVREAGTGTPIEGAMVVLLDPSSRPVFQVLTDAGGRFLMEHRTPGLYQLRADRIGHASAFHPEFSLGAEDTVRVEMVAPVEAIVLEGIDVDGDSRCRIRPEDGLAVATVWEEIRKALAAASWTGQHGVFRYDLTHIDRDLDQNAQRVEREQSRLERTSRQKTFVSRPVALLAEDGFVVRDGDETVFYGPDADVLLSDEFLETHCFRLRRGRRSTEGLLGLAFEPVDQRGVTDIIGTLWIDPAEGALRLLEWQYVNLELNVDTEQVGGRVEFVALPSGPWVIRKWWIRMPIIGLARGSEARPGRQLLGIREIGAQVRRVAEPTGRIVMEFEGGALQGTVRGGYGSEPLRGAEVEIVGLAGALRTDARGRYSATGLEGGVYGLRFSHPALDSVGFRSPDATVTVPPRGVAELDLTAPTPREVLDQRCGDDAPAEGTAALLGWLRREGGEAPAPGASVRIQWSRFDDAAGGFIRESGSGVLATADERGFYMACGVPTDTALRVFVDGAPRGAFSTVRIPRNEWRWYHDATVPEVTPGGRAVVQVPPLR